MPIRLHLLRKRIEAGISRTCEPISRTSEGNRRGSAGDLNPRTEAALMLQCPGANAVVGSSCRLWVATRNDGLHY